MAEDLYQALGVARGASEDAIKKAFKKLAKTSDGYVTITLEESGRCHLSRWRRQGGGSTSRGGAR